MKRRLTSYILAALLAAGIVEHFPWTLAALMVETFTVAPGRLRLSTSNDQYWEALALETRLIELGYSVTYVKDLHEPGIFGEQGNPVYGLTDFANHAVLVEADLSWDARLTTLGHEAGHVLAPKWLEGNQQEAFAEMVSALVSRDGLREHARYLAIRKWDSLFVFLTEFDVAGRAAATLKDL